MCHITSLRNLSCLFLKLSPDLFYHKEIRDTRKYRRCDPCRRIGETGERIAQKLHRRHGDNQSRDEFRYTSHHRQEAISAALHDISEDKDRAERKKEEGTHVTVSGSPWYHGIHIYISGEEQMETRFQE